MILCGDSVMWLAVAGLVGLACLFVLCVIGYAVCAYRWCDRTQSDTPDDGHPHATWHTQNHR